MDVEVGGGDQSADLSTVASTSFEAVFGEDIPGKIGDDQANLIKEKWAVFQKTLEEQRIKLEKENVDTCNYKFVICTINVCHRWSTRPDTRSRQ